jgi:hypothetical protein
MTDPPVDLSVDPREAHLPPIDVAMEERGSDGPTGPSTGRWGRYLRIGSGALQFMEEPRPTIPEPIPESGA